jgi:catechol 2,3-dioxygenase-like lactoylglutathione lyase family enzyme
MATIRHIAIYTDDPEKLAAFYINVFGLTRKLDNPADETVPETGSAVWVTDGYMDVALIRPARADAPRGINHFGFTLEPSEKAAVYQNLVEHGTTPRKPPPNRPYVEDAAFDCDGNKFDLSSGLRMQEGIPRGEFAKG